MCGARVCMSPSPSLSLALSLSLAVALALSLSVSPPLRDEWNRSTPRLLRRDRGAAVRQREALPPVSPSHDPKASQVRATPAVGGLVDV